MLNRIVCALIGHSRGPTADRVGIDQAYPLNGYGYVRCIRYCACCSARADSFSLVRRIDQGEIIPRGYGIAWLRWGSPHAVIMPVPLNLIAGALRRAWFWGKVPRVLFDDPRAAYRAGLQEGRRQQAEMDRFYAGRLGEPWDEPRV
jgi:hypothetical protein